MQTQNGSNHLNRKLSANFIAREFICPCCNKEGIKDALVFNLQLVHSLLPKGNVMVITTSFRCEKYNEEMKGAEDSPYLKGLAAHIKSDNAEINFHLIKGIIQVGFKRIGIYDDFIYVDMDASKPSPRVW